MIQAGLLNRSRDELQAHLPHGVLVTVTAAERIVVLLTHEAVTLQPTQVECRFSLEVTFAAVLGELRRATTRTVHQA